MRKEGSKTSTYKGLKMIFRLASYNFLRVISLDPDAVDILYFKLWIFGQTEVEVWFYVGSGLEYGTSAGYIYI